MSTSNNWIHLTTGKEFSRLLYPNPVCFLSTCGPSESNDSDSPSAMKNVMVLSWLTPTNNRGRFMFSINKSRYTASLLAPILHPSSQRKPCACEISSNCKVGVEFALSVPVRGMEQLVLDVGSASGRLGSKFPSTNSQETKKGCIMEGNEFNQLSNRQKKKLKKQQLSQHGIRGLIGVTFGDSSPTFTSTQSSDLFAIQGTVAYLHCRTYAVIGTDSSPNPQLKGGNSSERNFIPPFEIDEDHLLIMAEVIDAYVHPSYWDEAKLLFRPQITIGSDNKEDDVPPYLTFFGSQTFGYVTSSYSVQNTL